MVDVGEREEGKEGKRNGGWEGGREGGREGIITDVDVACTCAMVSCW